jgi:hypothetical protein
MWKNTVEEPGRRQTTIWGLSIACWIPKSKNTHSGYVILIAFVINSGCKSASICYVIHTLPILLMLELPVMCLTTVL